MKRKKMKMKKEPYPHFHVHPSSTPQTIIPLMQTFPYKKNSILRLANSNEQGKKKKITPPKSPIVRQEIRGSRGEQQAKYMVTFSFFFFSYFPILDK
ncbi:hypothetical protein L873DRAFT_1076947 [Choiromyces venosus 120613-1]|uniref:Uncharacterized protein n=1 Tax=Choiromyces venosus 120613-1 TaxID=1336337 RepID=A0A3N4JI14_9PEZI|nr:hypothetical protein L873DRAFT_1076947 [Choiromyces venosus 120613-1]